MQFKLPQILKAIESSITSSQTSDCGDQSSLLQFEQLFKDQNKSACKGDLACQLINKIQKQNQKICKELSYCEKFEVIIKQINTNIQSLIQNQKNIISYVKK
ncbi:Hypothetical_protein [Hexamita inflata]|uniref:Hypothetical_protein n=1 Tax=Hexamita inflata TaxID=28002 RepID=A0AA86V1B9_9EUKA|nr:Hypothetical protein HINF_LOCUS64364 [Hexamita inflata]